MSSKTFSRDPRIVIHASRHLLCIISRHCQQGIDSKQSRQVRISAWSARPTDYGNDKAESNVGFDESDRRISWLESTFDALGHKQKQSMTLLQEL